MHLLKYIHIYVRIIDLEFLQMRHVGPHEMRGQEIVQAEPAKVKEGCERAPHLG